MKKLAQGAFLLCAAAFCLETESFAHGGQYLGPGDTVPPGGGNDVGGGPSGPKGPAGPAPAAPTAPARPGALAPGAPGAATTARRPTTQGGGIAGPDLTVWSFWWELNKQPYLRLKAHVRTGAPKTGSDRFFVGRGATDDADDNMGPTRVQIRQTVVPALLAALEKETNNDIVTGCLIALAKIGDANTESGVSEFEGVIKKFLSDSNQEISETAAVALGILASDASVGTLEALLRDTPEGRELVGTTGVDFRTRAFAAYGLGLIGDATASEEKRQEIVRILTETIATDDTKSRDLKVACIIAMGLVPLDTIDPIGVEEGEVPAPHESRIGQLTYLLSYLQDEENRFLVRAHCPTSLARLLEGLPAEQRKVWRKRIVEDLLARAGEHSKEPAEVVQSAILALGLIGTNGEEDEAIRDLLEAVPEDVADQQARNFSMIAMAKVGGSAGQRDVDAGIAQASDFLLGHLSRGKSTVRPWAGLGIGVMSRELDDAGVASGAVSAMSKALRTALREEKDNDKTGAYAIAAGIMGDEESSEILLEKLERIRDDEARGYVAVALGLMSAREAVEPIQEIIEESKYRPELLKQAAIGLGLLGDKDLVPDLVAMLSEAKGLATQAAISSALGFIGDHRAIDPLVALLQNENVTATARGFAAVALGIVADKDLLPWNTEIARDLNYRAATQTLVDAQAGTGILDIL